VLFRWAVPVRTDGGPHRSVGRASARHRRTEARARITWRCATATRTRPV